MIDIRTTVQKPIEEYGRAAKMRTPIKSKCVIVRVLMSFKVKRQLAMRGAPFMW